jgi:hypothetical protein
MMLLAAALGPRAAEAGVASVWAVNDGEKVEQDDLAHPARSRNSAWDGATIRLFGAGNEVLAFQVMVESDGKGIAALSASLPELRRRGGAERIAYAPPGADPADAVGRPIQLFSVHYMNVTEPTHADWAWKPGGPAAPKDPTGWKPVQLVPENARAGRGGFPLAVAPRRNQAIWVEVYTGHGRPPGTYGGSLTVTADGQARRVPVSLELMPFTLPDENSMDAMIYYEPDQPERYQGRNLDDRFHRFAHRHRVELVHAYDVAAVRAHAGRFDGSDFTAPHGYEGPGEGVGNRIVPASFYGPGRGWEDRATAWSRADAWMTFLGTVLPKAVTFLYMPDEPRRAQFPEILALAGNVHSNPGPGGRLPVFVTKQWVKELDDAIDIWCAGPPYYDVARAEEERSRGRRYWTYNGGRPAAGAMTIDAPATDPRATIWACFKHHVDTYFYWHGVHWRHNSQKQGERDQDVWANPITFDNRGQPNKEDFGTLNGDGVLLYPGEEKLHPAGDRGVAGPVATIQLAGFRRGLQDHQYLTLARQRGLTDVVDAALRAVVPRVFSDAGETVGFAETGDAYEAVRRTLADAIVARGGAGARTPAPAAPPASAGSPSHPRLLVAERDPFSGLPALRARWAAGARPSDDLPGWALSYLLSGDEGFARRAVDELRRTPPASRGGSSLYLDTLKHALAFDWLYGYPGFDAALKDQLARQLVDAAERELGNPLLADPDQVAYHNHFVRFLSRAAVALWAVEGHPSVEARAAPMRETVRRALDNVLDSADMVTPDGGYHESMDYMRITFAPLAMLAEMRRTMGGDDPARRHGVFPHMGGDTYLYKVEPDGTTSRDDDNEWPHLQALDNVVLGYAVHRFKDPYAAWIQRESGWLPKEWTVPVLQFLWSDDTVAPRDPARTTDAELPRAKLFRGIGHFVMRDGWGPDSTWIEFDAGPFFAKHDHLDQGQFVIHRRGDLAIDSGADYTDTESPHYLNYYRRTVAHNSMLVYEPGETFFWGENLLPAANDGGQRMDSSRYWNTVRSREDFRRTRDLWDVARMEAAVHVPGAFDYARGDITRAYHPSKMERFTRELVYTPADDVLFVYDRVRATDPAFPKAWLLHGVNEPKVEGPVFTFEEGKGRLRVHSLLPDGGAIVARGGPGQDFWTPGDDKGGAWGSGRNWPVIPFEGGPLPEAPDLLHMWKTFWGQDLDRILPSNARSVVPGAWRVEVSPARPAKEDHFLHVMEIGDAGDARARRVERVQGHRLEGALVEGGTLVLFDAEDDRLAEGEVTLPDVGAKALLLTGLVPRARYDLQLTPNANPGAPMWRQVVDADESGLVHLPWEGHRNARLRLRKIQENPR